MKYLLRAGIVTMIFCLCVATSTTAFAAVKSFRNCKEMNKVYEGGVAQKGAKDKRKTGKAKYKPLVSNALYSANTARDADHDGIACER